jgi:type I restriction enzyme, S subunit
VSKWRTSTWGEEITLEYGKGIRGYSDAVGPYRVFGSNGPVGWTSEPLAPGPGVILGRKGAYRGVRFSPDPFFVIDTAYYVVPKKNQHMRWLYYAIIYHKLGEIDDGSPIPSTTRAAVYIRGLDVPPPEEQRAIASILGALDDKIDLNRRMNETLEALARAIFKDWFVDFGPTRAKMEGRAPYLAPEIWSLFPDRLDNEGKPAGWPSEALLNHARLISGGTPKTDVLSFWGGVIAWASAKDVSQCEDAFLISTERTITERGLNESATRVIPRLATVVVARGATTGRFCMFGREMAMNQTCYAIASIDRRPFWLNCAFGSLVEAIVHKAHGSVFDTITTNTIKGARVTTASPVLLDHFETMAEPLFSRLLSNVEESGTLVAMRDLLLPKLLSGHIRVKDVEKAVEAVA